MGADDSELTLDSLAQRLETQAQMLQTLERENARLRHKIVTLEGLGKYRTRLRRRRLSPKKRGV